VTSFVGFDLLQVSGQDVMPEPCTDRRKRLEDFVAGFVSPHVAIVPVTDDAARLWALWVGRQGGEGIMLKERSAPLPAGAAFSGIGSS